MNIIRLLINFLVVFLYVCCTAYDLPYINLGFTNILDGGPVRPIPGWYFFEYNQYYTSHKFLDSKGKLLDNVSSPKNTFFAPGIEFAYLSKSKPFLNARGGFDIGLPLVFYSKTSHNTIGIRDSGGGIGDLALGIYLQWDPVMYKDRPLYQQRIEVDFSFPTGRYKEIKNILTFNPGNGFIFFETYWAATLYFTPDWATSWRIYYTWSGKNKKTQVQAGAATHMNFSMEYQIIKNYHVAFCGYFLQQLRDSTLYGQPVPESKERVLGLGPGALYIASDTLYFFGYLYFETLVRNRTKGISFICKLIKQF